MSKQKTTIKGIENGRAKHAFDMADKVNKKLKDAYKSHVKKFPMYVKTNGLAAAITFLFSKGDKEKGVYKEVGNSIVEWLKEDDKYKFYDLEEVKSLQDLAENIIKIDSSDYRALTIEVLSYFTWLRRFAEGLAEENTDKEV